mmetsp:Transcript_42718/g.66921  ORF Transcript_42718/g.66921 Transcript_42718/m.66921 type:complete len:233 (-) Transcript_42718:986-1684(-)
MHSYMEPVSALPMYDGEVHAIQGPQKKYNRMKVVAGSIALVAVVALALALASDGGQSREELTPKFVDWKKEDAGSDDMNLHLKVADALARADGLAEKNLSPVPESLLKEAQQAAEEQRSMPSVVAKVQKKPKIPASLEKMFQQAEAEQQVEKLAKEGREAAKKAKENKAAKKKAAAKAEAAKRLQAKKKAETQAKAEKADSLKLLKQVAGSKPKAAPAAAQKTVVAKTAKSH